MNNNIENASVNRQDHGHNEGQQNNTPPVQQGEYQGQRHAENHNQPISNMLDDSEEQKKGRDKNKNDEEQ